MQGEVASPALLVIRPAAEESCVWQTAVAKTTANTSTRSSLLPMGVGNADSGGEGGIEGASPGLLRLACLLLGNFSWLAG